MIVYLHLNFISDWSFDDYAYAHSYCLMFANALLFHLHFNLFLTIAFFSFLSRVCGNSHGLIRKYGLMCCRQCFHSNAKAIGFIKVSFCSFRCSQAVTMWFSDFKQTWSEDACGGFQISWHITSTVVIFHLNITIVAVAVEVFFHLSGVGLLSSLLIQFPLNLIWNHFTI